MHHHHHQENIKSAVILNFVFSIIEFFAGILTNSLTVLADAVHDLGDAIILTFTYFSEKYAKKKTEDRAFTYGLTRLPLLSAFTNSLVMFLGSVIILWHSVERLQNPVMPHLDGMLGIAILGILVNGAAIFRMRKNEGLNSKVLTLHFFEDVFGWVAVLIISLVMRVVELPILDPILSISVTVYILVRVIMNLKQSIMMFIQKAPPEIDVEKLKKDIQKTKGVDSICDMHVWTLDSIHHIFTAHICLSEKVTQENSAIIKNKIRQKLKKYGEFHSTIEVEHESEPCSDTCA